MGSPACAPGHGDQADAPARPDGGMSASTAAAPCGCALRARPALSLSLEGSTLLGGLCVVVRALRTRRVCPRCTLSLRAFSWTIPGSACFRKRWYACTALCNPPLRHRNRSSPFAAQALVRLRHASPVPHLAPMHCISLSPCLYAHCVVAVDVATCTRCCPGKRLAAVLEF